MALRDQINTLKKEVTNVETTEENLRSKQVQLEQREDELEKSGSWSKNGKDVHEIEQAPLVKHDEPVSDIDKIKSGFTGLMSSFSDGIKNTMMIMGQNAERFGQAKNQINMKDLFEEKASKDALEKAQIENGAVQMNSDNN